jgi:uncharacterized protein (DUF983 family)
LGCDWRTYVLVFELFFDVVGRQCTSTFSTYKTHKEKDVTAASVVVVIVVVVVVVVVSVVRVAIAVAVTKFRSRYLFLSR